MSDKILEFMREVTIDSGYPISVFERAEKHVNQCMDTFIKFETEGELIKSELGRAGEGFGRLLDRVMSSDSGIKNIIPRVSYGEETTLESAMDDTPYTRTGINKYLRNIKAALKDTALEKEETVTIAHKIVPIVEELVLLNNRLNNLKSLVVVKKAAFVNKKKSVESESAKVANHKDTIVAVKFLRNMLEDDRSVLVDSLKVQNRRKADSMIDFAKEKNGVPNGFGATRERVSKFYVHTTPPKYLGSELMLISEDKNSYTEVCPRERIQILNFASKEVVDERIDKMSEAQAKYIIDEYVHKVSSKLGIFFVKKDSEGSMSNIEKLSISLGGNIDATLRVTFDDNSRFDLHTQTVWSENPVNPGYNVKVPSRFTNAYKPDGTKVKSPSEKTVQDGLSM
jgi:hypothetical protein